MKFDPEIFSDLYKDAYGFRPRFRYSDYTSEELDAMWDNTVKACEQAAEDERRFFEDSKKSFEKAIVNVILNGADTRAKAIRWLWEGYDPYMEDFDDFTYQLGLSPTDASAYEKEMKGE